MLLSFTDFQIFNKHVDISQDTKKGYPLNVSLPYNPKIELSYKQSPQLSCDKIYWCNKLNDRPEVRSDHAHPAWRPPEGSQLGPLGQPAGGDLTP